MMMMDPHDGRRAVFCPLRLRVFFLTGGADHGLGSADVPFPVREWLRTAMMPRSLPSSEVTTLAKNPGTRILARGSSERFTWGTSSRSERRTGRSTPSSYRERQDDQSRGNHPA